MKTAVKIVVASAVSAAMLVPVLSHGEPCCDDPRQALAKTVLGEAQEAREESSQDVLCQVYGNSETSWELSGRRVPTAFGNSWNDAWGNYGSCYYWNGPPWNGSDLDT